MRFPLCCQCLASLSRSALPQDAECWWVILLSSVSSLQHPGVWKETIDTHISTLHIWSMFNNVDNISLNRITVQFGFHVNIRYVFTRRWFNSADCWRQKAQTHTCSESWVGLRGRATYHRHSHTVVWHTQRKLNLWPAHLNGSVCFSVSRRPQIQQNTIHGQV